MAVGVIGMGYVGLPLAVAVLESTTYPGTTRERVAPILAESALVAGEDFNLAFSPERVDPGRTDYTRRTTPKVVGGLTEACGDRAAALYGEVCELIVRRLDARGRGAHEAFYLSWRAGEFDMATEFIELAGKVNQQMPYHCVAKVERMLNGASKPVRGSKITALGVSYKPGVGDVRESPGLKIVALLAALGGDLRGVTRRSGGHAILL